MTPPAIAVPAATSAPHEVRRRRLSADARVGLLLGLAAFVIYASGLRWGLPHATAAERVDSWGLDDHTPLGPLAEIENIINPKPNRNLGYPLLYFFIAGAAYAPYVGYLLVTGGLEAPTNVYPFGLRDPVAALRTLAFIAHLTTTLMAVAVVVSAYDAARVAWGRGTGVLAALFALTALPMFYYSRTGNVDMAMLCFIMLAYAAFSRMVMHGHTMRRAVALGIFTGLALAAKEAALGVFLGMPFVVVALFHRENPRAPAASWTFWRPHAIALIAAFIALGAGSGLFVEPSRYVAHLRFLASRVDALASEELSSAAVRTYAFTIGDHLAYASALIADLGSILNTGGLILAVAGVAAAVGSRGRQGLLAVPAATYLAWIFLTLRASQVRYVLPAAILLAGFAAYALLVSWRSRRPWLRYSAAAAGATVLLIQTLRGVDLTYQMNLDSRFAAAAWLEQNAKAGDRIEFFGPAQQLPPLEAGISTVRAVPFRGMFVPARVDAAQVEEIVTSWQQRQPRFVIAIPDYTSAPGTLHSHSFPASLFADLLEGRHGFRLAAFFRTPALFPWLPPPRLDYPNVNPPIHLFEYTAPAE